MLSTAFLMSKKKENFDQDASQNTDSRTAKAVSTFIKIFILLVILDIIIIIFGLYCLFSSGLHLYVVIPLVVLMFMPGIGTAVAIAVIIYHFATKHTSKPGAITPSSAKAVSDSKASLAAYAHSPSYQFF
jgi:NADH:ubiquinone oxidoreductase subunit 3 (subunit A)